MARIAQTAVLKAGYTFPQSCRGENGMIQIEMTPEEFAEAGKRLEEQQGVTLTGDEGKLTKMGVTAGYQYAEGLLRMTILDKPFFVSTEFCEEQLRGMLGLNEA